MTGSEWLRERGKERLGHCLDPSQSFYNVHLLSLLCPCECVKMKNELMIEYDSDSDSVLTDDGTNKLMIKGLITSHQTQLHIHTHTHTSVTYFLVNVNIRVCHRL